MISKRVFEWARSITDLSRKYGSSTLIMDDNHLLHVDPMAHSRLRRNYFLVLFWALASLYMVIQFYRNGEVDRCNLTFLYWTGGILLTTSYCVFYWFADDLCVAVNGTILLLKYLHSAYMPDFDTEKNKLNRFIEMLALAFVVISVGMSVLITLLCIYEPRGWIFLGVLVPEKYFYFPIRVLIILFHSYLMIPLGINWAILGCTFNIYLFYLTVVLTSELRLGEGRRYITSNELRSSKNIRHTFRSFQVLNEHVMYLFGKNILIFHGGFIAFVTYGVYILFRYWSTMSMVSKAPILFGMPAIVLFWSIMLWLGGIISARGNKLVGSWKGRKWGQGESEDKMMKKFYQSSRPVLISYGKQFMIKKVTLPNYLKGITRGIFRALLTLR